MTDEKIVITREMWDTLIKGFGYDRDSIEWLRSEVTIVDKFQIKHISTQDILDYLQDRKDRGLGWATFLGDSDMDDNIMSAMPPWVTFKMARAKMRNLIRRGLVEGCVCGCRGDFELPSETRYVFQEKHG